jgi:hypothetical protein
MKKLKVRVALLCRFANRVIANLYIAEKTI